MQRRTGTTVTHAPPPLSLAEHAASSSLSIATDKTKKTTTTRRRKVKVKPSVWNDVQRMAYDDGPFLLVVAGLGCFLLLLILIVAYKLFLELLWGENSKFGKRPGHHLHSHANDHRDPQPLPFNPIYRVPEAMDIFGDRSSDYAKLRQTYDAKFPLDPTRSLQFVQQVNTPLVHHSDQVQADVVDQNDKDEYTPPTYDIYHCPYEPPAHYPHQYHLYDQLLQHWPVDDTHVPDRHYQGLCVFDYQRDYATALHYRELELPFVVTNDPHVARTVERWHAPHYVEQMVGPTVQHRVEYNTNNHFLYHMPAPHMRGAGASRRQQQEQQNLQDAHGRVAALSNPEAVPQNMRMTFGEWLKHANASAAVGPHDEHWYFRLIGCGYMGQEGSCDKGSTEALFDELPYFQPRVAQNGGEPLYLGEPLEQKGIHCRFGMKGVIAENHFDGSRNAIALLYGQRRYILAHPNQCDKLALLPKQHPSARHSAVDYAQPDLETYPEFRQALSNEVVLQAGQVLYLPTNWFHYIVSLELNYQCNTRSGLSDHYNAPIEECGF